MGRKSKARKKKQPVKSGVRRRESVDVLEIDDRVTVIRDGENIYARNTRPPDEQQELLEAIRAQMLPRLRDKRQQLRDQLAETLKQADPVDLLARTGFMYLMIDPDTYKESESDRSTAHIEYLALQVLPNSSDTPQGTDQANAASLTGEAIYLVRELFDVEALLLTFGQAEDPQHINDQAYEYRARTRMESMGVRGTGYPEHLRAILVGTLGQFDADCERLLGFTAQQALDITSAIVSVVGDRLQPRTKAAHELQQAMLRQLPRQRRKSLPGPVPDSIVALKPTEAKRWIGAVARLQAFAEARSLATVTAARGGCSKRRTSAERRIIPRCVRLPAQRLQ